MLLQSVSTVCYRYEYYMYLFSSNLFTTRVSTHRFLQPQSYYLCYIAFPILQAKIFIYQKFHIKLHVELLTSLTLAGTPVTLLEHNCLVLCELLCNGVTLFCHPFPLPLSPSLFTAVAISHSRGLQRAVQNRLR